jgi:hypothetical protein
MVKDWDRIIYYCFLSFGRSFWFCFIKLLVLLPDRFRIASGFGRKSSGLLPEVSGNRKFLKLQLIDF